MGGGRGWEGEDGRASVTLLALVSEGMAKEMSPVSRLYTSWCQREKKQRPTHLVRSQSHLGSVKHVERGLVRGYASGVR